MCSHDTPSLQPQAVLLTACLTARALQHSGQKLRWALGHEVSETKRSQAQTTPPLVLQLWAAEGTGILPH